MAEVAATRASNTSLQRFATDQSIMAPDDEARPAQPVRRSTRLTVELLCEP